MKKYILPIGLLVPASLMASGCGGDPDGDTLTYCGCAWGIPVQSDIAQCDHPETFECPQGAVPDWSPVAAGQTRPTFGGSFEGGLEFCFKVTNPYDPYAVQEELNGKCQEACGSRLGWNTFTTITGQCIDGVPVGSSARALNAAPEPVGQYPNASRFALVAGSTLALSRDGDPGISQATGIIELRNANCVAPCAVEMTYLAVNGTDTSVDGHGVTGIMAHLRNVAVGIKEITGSVIFPPGAITLNANATLEGVTRPQLLESSEPSLLIPNGLGGWTLQASGSSGDGSLAVNLITESDNRPPVAVAPADLTLECDPAIGGAQLNLSGAASSDPDGDPLDFSWLSSTLAGAEGETYSTVAPLGGHEIRMFAWDGERFSSDWVSVSVVDTSAPELEVDDATFSTCLPAPLTVQLVVPSVADCSATSASPATGKIITINGNAITPIAIPSNGVVDLLPGSSYEIEWTAVAPDGLSTVETQAVDVDLNEGQSCCPVNTQLRVGTANQDAINVTVSSCVFGLGGGDQITTGAGTDFVFGGDGADQLVGFSNGDVFLGGAGADNVVPGFPYGGNVQLYGQTGDDSLQAVYAGSATIYGGPGNDHLVGTEGQDYIVPGAGVDAVQAMGGNDTIVIWNSCELTSGKSLDGGSGTDKLVTPVSVATLQAMGISVTGFETVVVSTDKFYLSECY